MTRKKPLGPPQAPPGSSARSDGPQGGKGWTAGLEHLKNCLLWHESPSQKISGDGLLHVPPRSKAQLVATKGKTFSVMVPQLQSSLAVGLRTKPSHWGLQDILYCFSALMIYDFNAYVLMFAANICNHSCSILIVLLPSSSGKGRSWIKMFLNKLPWAPTLVGERQNKTTLNKFKN